MSSSKSIRWYCYLGLAFLCIGQILLAQGMDFLAGQQPIDFAHWALLLAAVFLLGFNFAFSKTLLHTIASAMLIIGAVAHIGMSAIDFILWSFGDNFESRDMVVGQILNTPSIQFPFLIVGPAFLYTGLSLHGWRFIKTSAIPAVMTILGSAMIGGGQFILMDRMIVVTGTLLMSVGLVWLLHKYQIQD
ncbi:MAG: hypothetical protein HKN09_06465 [Saprospiraceae bacterium]|nr:hypothetical protein [Saprospiraceae bacterium]